jgi:polyisoprenoid-binding protein YceI
MRHTSTSLLALAALVALAAPARAGFPDTTYDLGKGSRVEYKLVHPLHKVLGTSGVLKGRVAVAKDKLLMPLRIALPLVTLSSGNKNRDGNALLTLAVDRFPSAVLEVSRFDEAKRTPWTDGLVNVTGTATGQLKLHGVARDVTIPLTAMASASGLTVDAEFDVSLTAHGIERPALLTVPVEDAVHVTVHAVGAPAKD